MTYVQGLKKWHKLLILCLQTGGDDHRIPEHSFVSSEKEVIKITVTYSLLAAQGEVWS